MECVGMSAYMLASSSILFAGTLQCQGKPAADQKVQMMIKDKLMKAKVASTVSTDKTGQFKIQGNGDSERKKSAYLWIEHKCDPKERAGCTLTTYIPISKKHEGKEFRAGTRELSKNAHYNSCDDADN
ncbi:Transthyretin-like family protein [Oesophagostomum dentatum]|uniref:Transthyretin-like family protein n=1 Tax=Oesophagostomum dentatum TaxID=61180 RepID=A0A0B1TCL3_OESDE|nr:Transthyretin-like family protein [Oesophagostomum dentatum]